MAEINKEIVALYRANRDSGDFDGFTPVPGMHPGCPFAEEEYKVVFEYGEAVAKAKIIDTRDKKFVLAEVTDATVISPAHQWTDEATAFPHQQVLFKGPMKHLNIPHEVRVGARSGLTLIDGILFIARYEPEGNFLLQRPVMPAEEQFLLDSLRQKTPAFFEKR